MAKRYGELRNERVSAASGVGYACRGGGEGAVALVLFQHFRGNLDNWDPALIDAPASTPRVVTFDNAESAALPAPPPTPSSRWRAMPLR
jgi:hypothetical protein